MEIVYKRIKEVFEDNQQVFVDRQVPAPRTIDIHLGQPDDPEAWEVFCPAIYIGWNKQPGPSGEPNQLTLDFHIIQEPGTATDGESDAIEEGLEYLRLIKACKYLLNGLKASNISPLEWQGERQAITQFFRYHIVTYTCTIDDEVESIHKPTYSDATIEKLSISGKLKEKSDRKMIPDIDVFK